MSENLKPFFGDESVKTVKLTDWMEWASSTSTSQRKVVLPMIQRGSVWAPHKLLDLWDTLLRGMPVGALMASEAVGDSIKVLGESGTRSAMQGDVGLIDGQQRTLSMLAGWPQGLRNPWRPVEIWLDLADEPQGEYRFRLWATTKAQPFGYARANMGGQPLSKLERHKLRLANQAFHPTEGKVDVQALWKQSDFMPWEAKFAIPLTELIAQKGTLLSFVQKRLLDYRKALTAKVATAIDPQDAIAQHFARKLNALPIEAALADLILPLATALDKVIACEFPVIHVRQESFSDQGTNSSKDNPDPPLAILFKRVGTGGEPLSNADYVYSVIKHHSPQVHDMVEELLKDKKIRAIYTPTTLVMSAVRLTMLNLKNKNGEELKLTDSATLDKAAFARMVRNHTDFIKAFEIDIQADGFFGICLKQVLNSISYAPGVFTTGLPKHALCLVQIPLLEALLAWRSLCKPSAETMEKSRLAMVRFILQGNLCVLDYAKASEVAIKALKEGTIAASETFPDQALLNLLAAGDKPLAYPLPSPEILSAINGLTISSKETKGLRGWTRFVAEDNNRKSADLYKRWWNRKGGHVHPMLLWLQRDYVYNKFEKEDALAGMDEETPFDFDHILPSAQWAYWTGSAGNNRFIDFPLKDGGKVLDGSGHWHIGNSIGNIHVLDSSTNRELGDDSVHKKLKIADFAKNALIGDAENMHPIWQSASVVQEHVPVDDSRYWDEVRALAFQSAVEQRAFFLYKKFYEDLHEGKFIANFVHKE